MKMKRMFLTCLFILSTKVTISFINCLEPPTVLLSNGTLEGFYKHTIEGQRFLAFEGVPYAAPPVEELRFEEPKPVSPWKGVWKAKTMFECMQLYHYTPPGQDMIRGDEDCLYLNIYTPNLNPSEKMDVLVYIHGGAFMFNKGGNQGPEFLMDRDIVYINLNYRLGPLGFLSTEDDTVPGNMGLKDQQMALKWIKENIHHFGGNPESVTISGNSAGGASVQLHTLLPSSQGLFHKGFSQSGTALNSWALVEEPLGKTIQLANVVGCPTDTSNEVVNCLRRRPAKQIVGAVRYIQAWLYNPFTTFGPVFDKWASVPLLPDHPYNLLKEMKVQNLPWMVSYVSGEGLYPGADFYTDDKLKYIEDNWDKVIPYVLHYNDVTDIENRDLISKKIWKEYFGEKHLSKATFSTLIKLMSDRLFIADIETAGKLHSAAIDYPVYCYYFDYRGAQSKTKIRINSNENIGVSHTDDNAYMFRTDIIDTLSTEEDIKMTKIMVDLLSTFVKKGEPDVNVEWRPLYKDVNKPWVQLAIRGPVSLKLEEIEEIGNRRFWDSLLFKENEHISVK